MKTNARELLRRELQRPSWRGELIALSGVTDCYQPLEASYSLTRRSLEVCLEFRQPVILITKGALVRRDAQDAFVAESGDVAGPPAAESRTRLDQAIEASPNDAELRELRARWLLGLGFFVVFVLVWAGFTLGGLVSPTFLASPVTMAQEAWLLFTEYGFHKDIGMTVWRVLGGFVLAAVIAVPLGIAMGAYKGVEAFFEPFVSFCRYLPASAFIPLLILWAGIGDTIRVSLAADPVEEIRVGHDLLKSLGLRQRGVTIIACPSCARQGFNVIKTVEALEERLAHIATPMSLSIIGCVVNGPGEATMTDLGFTGGGKDAGMMYVSGKPDHKVTNAEMVDRIVAQVEARAAVLRAAKEAAAKAATATPAKAPITPARPAAVTKT